MGYGKWSSTSYHNYRKSYAGKGRDDIFTANRHGRIDPKLDPFRIGRRESRDSAEHPNSVPIALFLDVTGSMGMIPEDLVRNQLGTIMDTLLQRGVADPQLMFSGIGDQYSDRAPLQVGQFESSTELINDGLGRLWLEGGGGGSGEESYALAWQTAARHTSIDSFEKRGKKGFLFTVGDEQYHTAVEAQLQMKVFGYNRANRESAKALLREAQEQYHVFHVHINSTGYRNNTRVIGQWREVLGDHFLVLNDHTRLGELVAAVVTQFSKEEEGEWAYAPELAGLLQ